MKKRLLMMLVVMLLLGGCGNADTKTDTQQTETESTNETETVEVNTEETTEVSTEAETEDTTEINTEVESEAPTESESTTEADSEVSAEPEAPTYTYTDLDKSMYAKSSVNVRDLPSTDGNKLGSLSKAQEVHVTGQCNETNWYRIEYSGGVGYVSNNYLQDSKPVEEVATTTTTTTDTTQTSEVTVESQSDNGAELIDTMVDNYDHIIVYILNGQGDHLGLGDQACSILAERFGCTADAVWLTMTQEYAGFYNGYDIWKDTYYKP